MHLLLANRLLYNYLLEDTLKLTKKEKKFNKWTGEKRNKMFKNILDFPRGTYHLGYFDINPHPDKISDNESLFFELFNQHPNEDIAARKVDFELVRSSLEQYLSQFDKKLLTLPSVLQKEIDAGSDGGYITALTHLRDCFYRYFSTPVEGNSFPEIQWIDYSFIANYYPAQKALADLRNNLFNKAAVENLVGKLREAGAFGNKIVNFYFWNTSPYNWDDISYQAREVSWESLPFANSLIDTLSTKLLALTEHLNLTMPTNLLPHQYIALGNFTINALPEGYVCPKGHGNYDICIQKMYYFINDSFNFEDFAPLGLWRLNEDTNGQKDDSSLTFLFNSDFRNFKKHGYGREFPVLSKLHEVENFEPQCISYPDVK